ncbi:MAG: hypothetical protein IRY95_01885 [Clostridia bacterium]|nr:hypothetical protein [Clostridia bacterium]
MSEVGVTLRRTAAAIGACLVLLAAGGSVWPGGPAASWAQVARRGLYEAWLTWSEARLLARVEALPVLARGPVAVHFPAGDEAAADLTADLANRYWEELARDLGVRPPDHLHVVVSPSAEDLAGQLGLRPGQSALGAYWRGVVWVLSPGVWLGDAPGWGEAFVREGPVVHELAHAFVDRATAGRVPLWLSEGVAQYEEYRLLGYEWREPSNRLNQPLYTLRQLQGGFVRLPNEALAYREAFLFVRYLVEGYGEGALRTTLAGLAEGRRLSAALQNATGRDLPHLEAEWTAWLHRLARAEGAEGMGASGAK